MPKHHCSDDAEPNLGADASTNLVPSLFEPDPVADPAADPVAKRLEPDSVTNAQSITHTRLPRRE